MNVLNGYQQDKSRATWRLDAAKAAQFPCPNLLISNQPPVDTAFSRLVANQPQSMGAEESARRRSVGLPLPGEHMRSGDVERKTRACKGEPRTGLDSLVNLMQVIV